MQIHESVEIEGEHHTGFVRGGILLRLLVENRFSDMRALFARLKQTLHDQNDVGRIQRQTADQLGLCFFPWECHDGYFFLPSGKHTKNYGKW